MIHKLLTIEAAKPDVQLQTVIYPKKSEPRSPTDRIHSWGCAARPGPATGKKRELRQSPLTGGVLFLSQGLNSYTRLKQH